MEDKINKSSNSLGSSSETNNLYYPSPPPAPFSKICPLCLIYFCVFPYHNPWRDWLHISSNNIKKIIYQWASFIPLTTSFTFFYLTRPSKAGHCELEQRSLRSEAYLWNLAIYNVITICICIAPPIHISCLFRRQAIQSDHYWEGRTLSSQPKICKLNILFLFTSLKLFFSVKTLN